jgi:hypothetical protein
MPRGDGTGPMGMGPMTGRAAGYCAGYPVPGFMNPWGRRGFGMGFGRGRGWFGRGAGWGGRGWRNMYWATGMPGWMRFGGMGAVPPAVAPTAAPPPEVEKQFLEGQLEMMENEIKEIRKRLAEIASESEKKS